MALLSTAGKVDAFRQGVGIKLAWELDRLATTVWYRERIQAELPAWVMTDMGGRDFYLGSFSHDPCFMTVTAPAGLTAEEVVRYVVMHVRFKC